MSTVLLGGDLSLLTCTAPFKGKAAMNTITSSGKEEDTSLLDRQCSNREVTLLPDVSGGASGRCGHESSGYHTMSGYTTDHMVQALPLHLTYSIFPFIFFSIFLIVHSF